jgi:hypothetical protein
MRRDSVDADRSAGGAGTGSGRAGLHRGSAEPVWVADAIDGWYNTQRIQKKLGGRSPDEFEVSHHHPVPVGT